MTRHQNLWLGLWALFVGTLALDSTGLVGLGLAAEKPEKTGTVQQPLVGGKPVSEGSQEAYGLLTISSSSGSCSASLLRNDWVITAAHCLEAKDATGNTMPDPARPRQNVLSPIGGINVRAAWSGGQSKKAVRVDTFLPYDIALIKVDSPFSVSGKTTGYWRDVFQDGQFPYFGHPVAVPIMAFGRGISKFATGSGNTAKPSEGDGQYRVGHFKTTRLENDILYWYPSAEGQMVAGGDSGGPSFASVAFPLRWALVGVHAMSHAKYAEGKPKTGWTWATATTEAADAPIAPVWEQISQIMGPMPLSPPDGPAEPQDPKPDPNVVPFGTIKPDFFHILYTVEPDGTLLRHKHIMSSKPVPAAKDPRFDGMVVTKSPVPDKATRSGVPASGTATPKPSGGLRQLSKNELWHVWEPPQTVSNRWENFKAVLPAGQSGIYALTSDGVLQWYRHDGAYDGSSKWAGPVQVGTGWSTFEKLVTAGDGVLYGVYPDGVLRWYKHNGYKNARGGPSEWAESKNVAKGWNFKNIFSGGEGILYFVNADGKLMWTKHKAYLDAVAMPGGGSGKIGAAQEVAWANSWEVPKEVGTSWGHFTKIFSAGEGDIYAVQPSGELYWYKHDGWQDGSPRWRGGVPIATGWGNRLFALGLIYGGGAPIVK